MSDSLIIIPTFNEIENIEKIIRKIFSLTKPFHILIIEDNTDICLALELLLELNGLKVSSVHTVKDAQLLLQRKSVDLIIQDMNFSTGFVSGEEGRRPELGGGTIQRTSLHSCLA